MKQYDNDPSARRGGRKRDPDMPAWFCAHGVPRGEEAALFRGRGLVPINASRTYTAMVRSTGIEVEYGHDERGDGWLWVPPLLRGIIPSGLLIDVRQLICSHLGALAPAARSATLIELDAVLRLGGPHAVVTAVFGDSK